MSTCVCHLSFLRLLYAFRGCFLPNSRCRIDGEVSHQFFNTWLFTPLVWWTHRISSEIILDRDSKSLACRFIQVHQRFDAHVCRCHSNLMWISYYSKNLGNQRWSACDMSCAHHRTILIWTNLRIDAIICQVHANPMQSRIWSFHSSLWDTSYLYRVL